MILSTARARRRLRAAAGALLVLLSAAAFVLALTSARAAAAPANAAARAVTVATNPASTAKPERSPKPTGGTGATIPRPTVPPVVVQESGIVVDSSDPPPFSTPQGSGSAGTAIDAVAFEPVGALSGISLGAWLGLWPILLVLNLAALAALARIVVRAPAPKGD